MNTHTDKAQENKSQSVSNSLTQKEGGSESTFQFADNRPEAIAQRKMQELANTSSQVSQLRAFQAMADNSPQVKQADQQAIQKKGNDTGQQETDNDSPEAKNDANLKPSEIMKQKIEAANKSDKEGDETSSPSLAEYAKQIMVEEEDEEEEQDWDFANESDTAEVQVSLPTVEQFARQTDAGLFARRDDLLKQIDGQLQRCNWDREQLYKTEVWLSNEEAQAKYDEDMKERMKEDLAQKAQSGRERFKGELDQLHGLVSTWLTQFKDDKSKSVIRRYASIEALLSAIKSEQKMTTEKRVQNVKDKNEKEKAAAEVASRTLFTVEEFKAESNIWVVVPFSNISDVVSALEAFHAIQETPGDDSIRLRKIDACHAVRSAASAANADLVKLKSHPGYEKGHMGFEKKSIDIRKKAINKLSTQCGNYYVHNRTAEEKAAREAEVKAEIKAKNEAWLKSFGK